MPQGQEYVVAGDGHPNELSHNEIGECINQKIKLNN